MILGFFESTWCKFWIWDANVKKIQDLLGIKWHNTQRIWFHDDIIPQMEKKLSQDSWRVQHFMNATKQQVYDRLAQDNIFKGDFLEQNEYDLITEAEEKSIPEIITKVQKWGTWRYQKDKKSLKWPRRSNIRLYWYRKWNDIPSCEVLDYTFYKKRIRLSNPTITLIHENMRGQQRKVHQLFQFSWSKPEIIVLFHDGERLTDYSYWGESDENEALWKELLASL